VIQQAKRDLDAGQVDTDMHATPGLDALERERLVPKRQAEKAPAPAKTDPAGAARGAGHPGR